MMPQDMHREAALGLTKDQLRQHPEFDAQDWFQPIPTPTNRDDWLAQYVPDNQTFQRWERSTRQFRKQSSGKTIYIVQIGDFDEGAPELAALVEYTAAFFDPFPVKLLPYMKIVDPENLNGRNIVQRPKSRASCDHYALLDEQTAYPLPSRRCHPYYEHLVHEDHLQLKIDPILDILEDIRPADALCVIAVTMHDLFEGKEDAFAVGMATGVKDKIGVFSFCRYDPLFDQSEPRLREGAGPIDRNDDNYKKLLLRSCRVLAHEIGHLAGMEHCSYYDCMMNGSGHLEEDFSQSMHLCPVDLRKILTLTGATWVEFYDRLLQFYNRHGFVTEREWIKRRVGHVFDLEDKLRAESKSKHRDLFRANEIDNISRPKRRKV